MRLIALVGLLLACGSTRDTGPLGPPAGYPETDPSFAWEPATVPSPGPRNPVTADFQLVAGNAPGILWLYEQTSLNLVRTATLHRSDDGARTWTATAGPDWGELFADPSRAGRLWLVETFGNGDGYGLHRSDDFGATWQLVSRVHSSSLASPAATFLPFAVDPAGTCYRMGPSQSDLVERSMDGGSTWTALPGWQGQGLEVESIAAPAEGWLYVVARRDRLRQVLVRSSDGGASFVETGLPGRPAFDGAAAAAAAAHAILASRGKPQQAFLRERSLFRASLSIGTQVRVWRTSDAGASWTELQLDALKFGRGELTLDEAGELFFYGSFQLQHVGVEPLPVYPLIARSADGGTTWRAAIDGIWSWSEGDEPLGDFVYAVTPDAGGTAYALVETSAGTRVVRGVRR